MKKFYTSFAALCCACSVFSQTVDLSTYVRVGRFDLPEPTRTAHPANSLLAQEASAVTYNWDTQTLFVVGDGGTSVVQVSKTGSLINSMTLAPGGSPQGTDFYDPEGLTYVGNNQFVFSEERDRQAVLFTYVAGGILTRADAKTVKLGTFVQNIGIEGISFDPLTGGFICVKEKDPQGIFQTGIDFLNGTATNGSPTTENSINLFDPALLGLLDIADVFALSNLPALNGQPNYGNLLVLSQESGKILNVDRTGHILNSLTIVSDPGNPLDVVAQQHEGITMDRSGNIYTVSENGGGDFDHPQLWVYSPATTANLAPTAVSLSNTITSIQENTSTLSPIKVADILINDDGQGTNNLYLTGTDTAFFQVTGTALFIKAGTVIDYETKTSYSLTVNVDDTTVGGRPDASVAYTLAVTDVIVETPPTPTITISEVAPWSSGNSPVAADWFEVTNNGSTGVNITGWKMDDNSNSFGSSVALNGVTNIAPGESVIFIETATPGTTIPTFISTWFGLILPAGLQIGSYSGSGVGLSTGGDAVNLFDASGTLQAKVTFGASPAGPFATFNNAAGLNNTTISQLSLVGVNGAFAASADGNEIGSPGTVGRLIISEVAPWSSGNSPVAADWFEVTNNKATPVDITGWKMDDNSGSPAAAVPLSGITTIAPGESVIFTETATLASTAAAFRNTWFGSTPPTALQIGAYSGSGVGLSTSGDAVNLYDAAGVLQASVIFGASSSPAPFKSFDNAAGLNNLTISTFSEVGVNGAFVAKSDPNEIGSPGRISPAPIVVNKKPQVAFVVPNAPITVDANSTVTITAAASDSDGVVIKVDLLVNGAILKTDSAAPYDFTTANVPQGNYYIRLRATDDSAGVTLSGSILITVNGCQSSGGITAEGYTNIPGGQISDLTSNAAYPNNPTIIATLSSLQYSNITDNYGGRLRGYFCAPASGQYRFAIAADDQAGVWLSTDDNPEHKTLIAYTPSFTAAGQYNAFGTQQSALITLVQGGRYYIETLHKEAVGPDHLSVAVTLPDGSFEAPIGGNRLSTFSINSVVPVLGQNAFATAMAGRTNTLETGLTIVATPNPTTAYFTLRATSQDIHAIDVSVTDIQGRLVERKRNVGVNGTMRIGEALRAGVYFLEVTQGKQTKRLKLIKE